MAIAGSVIPGRSLTSVSQCPAGSHDPDDLGEIREHVRRKIGKVSVPKAFVNVHSEISKILRTKRSASGKSEALRMCTHGTKPISIPNGSERLQIPQTPCSSQWAVRLFLSGLRSKEGLEPSIQVGDYTCVIHARCPR